MEHAVSVWSVFVVELHSSLSSSNIHLSTRCVMVWGLMASNQPVPARMCNIVDPCHTSAATLHLQTTSHTRILLWSFTLLALQLFALLLLSICTFGILAKRSLQLRRCLRGDKTAKTCTKNCKLVNMILWQIGLFYYYYYYYNHFTTLCLGLPRWVGSRRINHSRFYWSRDDAVVVASAEPYASHLHLTATHQFLRGGWSFCHPIDRVRANTWLLMQGKHSEILYLEFFHDLP